MIERGIFQFLGTLKLFHDSTTGFLFGDTAILMAEMFTVYFFSLHINAFPCPAKLPGTLPES